jgi:DNA-binding LacI/PurR family transcriptional regulator
MRAADELGYRPNLIARHLASKRTRTFGLLINDLHNPYFPGVADGIESAAEAHGYRLLISSAFLSDRHERTALDTFVDFNVDGIILTGSQIAAGAIEEVARTVPVVVVSRPMRSKRLDTINNDDRLGARLVVEHLIGLGHEHVMHIDGGRGAGAAQRRSSYEATMRAYGLEPRVAPGAFTEAAGAAAAARALKTGRLVTAVFAGNDLSALGALDSIEAAGLSVPGDVSLVGYDNTFVAALRHVGLTTVDQRREQLGGMAVEALIERIEGDRTRARHEVIPPSLVVRDTTGPPRRS